MASRIDTSFLKRVGGAPKSEPAAPARSPQANAVRGEASQFQARRNVDAFLQGAGNTAAALTKLSGPPAEVRTLAQSQGGACPLPLSPADDASANDAIGEAIGRNDASYIVDWLKEHPNPATQAAFMDLLFSVPGLGGDILDDSADLSPADQQVLSDALNSAWESGAVTAEELAEGVGELYAGALPGDTHEALANIIAGTGNPEIIEAYAKRELEIITASRSEDPQRAAAVATALAGLPPDELADFLAKNPEAVDVMLKNINSGQESEYSPALGKLLDAASRIDPPTDASIKLFMDAIPHLGENTESRAAAARFFTQHGDAVLQSVADASGSIQAEGAGKLSEFFTRTLFSPPPFEGQEAFRTDVMQKLGDMQAELELHARENPPSLEAQSQARMMGSLVGALEGGFLLAVEELNKRNEATKGLVDLIFSAKGLIPDLPVPGFGKLKDLTIDQIQEWVTDSLKEHPDDPEKAIPFHELFGEAISNPALRSYYDAARLTALENRELGLD